MRTWSPTGVKGVGSVTPKSLAAYERRVQIIRNRYERWLRRKYRALLRDLRLTLSEASSDAEITSAVERFGRNQEKVMRRYYSALYPKVAELGVPDSTLKSWSLGLETKGADELDARMNAWIESAIGVNIRYIDEDTLRSVRALYRQANGDTERFKTLLSSSGLFSSSRADRIAVTETTSGINRCMGETSREYSFGRKRTKTWQTTGMLNVRSTHRMMNGVTIDADELFRVPREDGGYDLMEFPGDSSHGASAGNLVNCHCLVFYSYVD